GLGGADIFAASAGGDKFVYIAASDSPVGGGDKIYGFDKGTTGNSHDTLDFHAFGITAADVTVSNSSGNTIVQANTDHAGGADLEITLVGVTLDKADIAILY